MGDVIVGISTFIRENKVMSICIGIGIVVLLVLYMAISSNKAESSNEATQSEATEQEAEQQQEQADEQQSEDASAVKVELTPHQRELLASSADYTDLYGHLLTSTWTNARESQSITFGDKYYQEAGRDEIVTFVITNAYTDKQSAENEVWYIDCIGADNKPFFMVLTIDYANERTMTIQSDNFVNADTYSRVASTDEVTLHNVPDEVYTYCGITADELSAQVADYCSYMFPTTRNATFSEVLSLNFEKKQATFSVTLDNESKTSVPIVVDLDSAEIHVGQTGATR